MTIGTEIQKKNEDKLFTREAFDEPRNFTELLEACKILVASKIMPKEIDTPEKAAVVILTGRELGLRMMASTRSVYVVNGKPSLSAQMMLSLAYGTKELEDIEITEEGQGESAKCTVAVKRKGKKSYSYSFSVEMAKKMGKYQNEWLKQPENMAKQRAISGNLRVTFPDAILGMYTPEEIQSVEVEETAKVEMPKAKQIAETPTKRGPEAVPSTKPQTNQDKDEALKEEIVYASEKHRQSLEKLAKQADLEGPSYLDFLAENGVQDPDKINRQQYGACMKKIAVLIDEKAKKVTSKA